MELLQKNASLEKVILGECSAHVNGIDRIDSSEGYTLTNVIPCCTKCNRMKLNYTTRDFIDHISKIYHFMKVKGSTTISKESTPQANGGGNGGSSETKSDIV